MKIIKSLCLVTIGGIGGYTLAVKHPIHEPIKNFVNTKILKHTTEESNDIYGIDEASNAIIEQSNYILLDSNDNSPELEGSEADNDSQAKDSGGSVLYIPGKTDNREFVSDYGEKEYDDFDSANDTVSGALHLVTEEDIYPTYNEENPPNVVKIDAVEFVKGVAAGAAIKPMIFDLMTKSFYWNFTNERISMDDVYGVIGKDNADAIVEEWASNVTMFASKYFYDVDADYYIKIDVAAVVNV